MKAKARMRSAGGKVIVKQTPHRSIENQKANPKMVFIPERVFTARREEELFAKCAWEAMYAHNG